MSGLGAGLDSFYEYMLKSFILFGDAGDLRMFEESYEAIKANLRRGFVMGMDVMVEVLVVMVVGGGGGDSGGVVVVVVVVVEVMVVEVVIVVVLWWRW